MQSPRTNPGEEQFFEKERKRKVYYLIAALITFAVLGGATLYGVTQMVTTM